MSEKGTAENIAQTLARELPRPLEIGGIAEADVSRIALPPGWTLEKNDDSVFRPAPRRKRASVLVETRDSFIDYVNRHGPLTSCTIWANSNYKDGIVTFTGIINDHGAGQEDAAWRDHLIYFDPRKSVEWETWNKFDHEPFTQAAFALFIEDNLKDISTQPHGETHTPGGVDMLQMALAFEAVQDMRFKSALRLQSGGVEMAFTQDDDAATINKMKAFDRFAIGIPVFDGDNADGYVLFARLRYRVKEGKLTFWYELIRPDKVLKAASDTLIGTIREKTKVPLFFGQPFA